MKLRTFPTLLALGVSAVCAAETIDVTTFSYAGPYAVTSPYMMDSVDMSARKYEVRSKLSTPVSLDLAARGRQFTDSVLPATKGDALHLLSFTLDNSHYASARLKVTGIRNYEMYVDGKKYSGNELKLTPRTREVVLKCLSDSSAADTLKVAVETSSPQYFTVNPSGGRRYCTRDIFTGQFIGSVSVSPRGRYMYTGYYHVEADGKNSGWEYVLTDLSSGRELMRGNRSMSWMPRSEQLYYTRERGGKTQLVTVDPATGAEKVMAAGLPTRQFTIAPTEDFIVYSNKINGPKEKNDGLYQIITPEDRQPGWRDRGQLMKYDFATGLSVPLTFGHKQTWLSGISDDGDKVLFQVSEDNLGKRPSSLVSMYLLSLSDMSVDTVCSREPFLGTAMLSPDATKVAVIGSPEAFEGVGRNLPDDMVPSMVDNQLFLIDVATRKATPLTRDFDPSLDRMRWSRADGCIYFSAEHRDSKPLYRVNPSTGKVESLGVNEYYVKGYGIASDAPVLAYYGQGADNAARLYTLDTRKLRSTLRDDLAPERTEGVNIVPTHDWTFKGSRGDTIYAYYNLPPDFDPEKKYPVIIYYYGGCSPVGRFLDTTYNPHLFASHGFISLVINPSGATGFGQEFSSRHVATAGEGVAQDIIDGVKQFCAQHPYADAAKVGCCGASYGGFMTQYLQTVTDIFAAAVSHAGISDHTSYWGEGYWGYSYSEVSMANKYPWSDRELYVARSPLYNADKVNTPLLFLHGDADTNVPVGESIQMFTALKLLGKETAMVAVKGQDHHILDFDKREKWLDTMLAWFTKYLQDDPSWWDDMYPQKQL